VSDPARVDEEDEVEHEDVDVFRGTARGGTPKGSWNMTPGEVSWDSLELGERIGTLLFLLDRIRGEGEDDREGDSEGSRGDAAGAASCEGAAFIAGNWKAFMAAAPTPVPVALVGRDSRVCPCASW